MADPKPIANRVGCVSFFFSSRRRHTRLQGDWSSDVCSSDLGYVPQFEGFGCAATRYCAAMTIDSLTQNQNTGAVNNADCNNYILGGIEPVNWAYITKSGVSQAPADPLFTGTLNNPNLSAVNPDFNRDLMMKPGDRIRIHLPDTPAGFRADLTDLTTNQTGSMTASVAIGFAHVLYEPTSNTCHSAPYAFHPEYSTANPRGNTWSAHTYNVAFSDEIGHFEHCPALDQNFNCAVAGSDDPGGLDSDDVGCVPGKDAWVVHINGCFGSDIDFDGPSYQQDWPGTNPDPRVDQRTHPEPVIFTSPTTSGGSDRSGPRSGAAPERAQLRRIAIFNGSGPWRGSRSRGSTHGRGR